MASNVPDMSKLQGLKDKDLMEETTRLISEYADIHQKITDFQTKQAVPSRTQQEYEQDGETHADYWKKDLEHHRKRFEEAEFDQRTDEFEVQRLADEARLLKSQLEEDKALDANSPAVHDDDRDAMDLIQTIVQERPGILGRVSGDPMFDELKKRLAVEDAVRDADLALLTQRLSLTTEAQDERHEMASRSIQDKIAAKIEDQMADFRLDQDSQIGAVNAFLGQMVESVDAKQAELQGLKSMIDAEIDSVSRLHLRAATAQQSEAERVRELQTQVHDLEESLEHQTAEVDRVEKETASAERMAQNWQS